jgi:hypothetical protein
MRNIEDFVREFKVMGVVDTEIQKYREYVTEYAYENCRQRGLDLNTGATLIRYSICQVSDAICINLMTRLHEDPSASLTFDLPKIKDIQGIVKSQLTRPYDRI